MTILPIEKILNQIKNTLKKEPYSIVSLGPNCYPRTVLTRMKLMKQKNCGRLTMPFDFAYYHSAKYVTEFLKNDFSDFFEDLHYSDFCKSFDSGKKINFSHEAYISKNNKSKLIKIYEKRILNFRKEIKKSKPILFLQILKDEEVGEDCKNTYFELKKLCGTRKFAYIVIDLKDIVQPNKIPFEIYLTKMHLPTEDSCVFSPDFYNSEYGKFFEKKIANFVENVIMKEFGLNTEKFL